MELTINTESKTITTKSMSNLTSITEHYGEETFLIADGFDDAIIGVDEKSMRLIYSVSKCIEILCKDMSEDEAMEYFTYNVEGSYMVEKNPIWCWDNFSFTLTD